MEAIAYQMVAQWRHSRNNVIECKGEEKKRPIIVAFESNAGQGVFGEPVPDIFQRKAVNKRIVNYPISIVPKKRIV